MGRRFELNAVPGPALVLVDTSAWVEYLRGSTAPSSGAVKELLLRSHVATTDVVFMELLAGARDEAHATAIRRLLLRGSHVPVDGVSDYEAAAAMYRLCRSRGATVRKMTDCLIATVAVRAGLPILHNDRDFSAIALNTSLRVAAGSLE